MSLFSMRLVEHIPGVSRVYKNALGFTTKITRQECLTFKYPEKSYVRVSKNIELSNICHGKHAPSNSNMIPILQAGKHIYKSLYHNFMGSLHRLKNKVKI